MQQRINKLRADLEKCPCGNLPEAGLRREQVIGYKLDRLEEQLDIFWRQRAHATWLVKGDRNTEFFHNFASARKKKNRTEKLIGEDGVEVKGMAGLKELITNHFLNLFTPMAGPNFNQALQAVQPKVTPQMNDLLRKKYTLEEVKRALDDMGDLKAPGADGMPAIFYKRIWSTEREAVTREVLHVLRGGSIADGWNESIVVLIPKVRNPNRIKDLCPISLCNVVYKLVSKVLANRLKVILDELISSNQSAFVPGRLISDNTILAYEMTCIL